MTYLHQENEILKKSNGNIHEVNLHSKIIFIKNESNEYPTRILLRVIGEYTCLLPTSQQKKNHHKNNVSFSTLDMKKMVAHLSPFERTPNVFSIFSILQSYPNLRKNQNEHLKKII